MWKSRRRYPDGVATLKVRVSRLGNPRSNMHPDVTARPQLPVTDEFAEATIDHRSVVQVSMGVVLVTQISRHHL